MTRVWVQTWYEFRGGERGDVYYLQPSWLLQWEEVLWMYSSLQPSENIPGHLLGLCKLALAMEISWTAFPRKSNFTDLKVHTRSITAVLVQRISSYLHKHKLLVSADPWESLNLGNLFREHTFSLNIYDVPSQYYPFCISSLSSRKIFRKMFYLPPNEGTFFSLILFYHHFGYI